MKSKLFKAVFGIGLFALALNVNANTINSVTDGSNATDATVTVGEVAAPVYEVSVSWDDLTFDWTYDYETEKFGWKPADTCSYISFSDSEEFDNYLGVLYADENCTTEAEDNGSNAIYYAIQPRESASIDVRDYSENGQIVPSIKWNSSTKYEDVTEKLKYLGDKCVEVKTEYIFRLAGDSLYTDASCSSVASTSSTFEEGKYYTYALSPLDLNTEELPDSARITEGLIPTDVNDIFFQDAVGATGELPKNSYHLNFNLEGGSTTPTSGDEIGTITISIRAK